MVAAKEGWLGISVFHTSARLALLTMLMLCAHPVWASDPLPGDAIAPPTNINIVLYYNIFTNAGVSEPAHGNGYAHGTHISLNVQALRYIRTFTLGGMLAGVQVVQPYASFVGKQTLGLPPAGRFTLSHQNGFTQPYFGAFIFPVSNPTTGTNLALGFWFEPPIGHYDKNANLSLTQNLWNGELEAGGRTLLLGTPMGQNLAAELWGEGYFYGSNNNATLAGIGGAAPARLSQQPTGEIRFYLPYQFFPPSLGTIVPGIYQTFGGKQVYTLADGTKLDAGTRTQETQLRLTLSSYLSRHWQLMLNGQYDLVAHGGPLEREVELRVAMLY
jgi:Putative MetA-pathway of phenol degradation